MGGFCGAAIKGFKIRLTKITGNQKFTFEEFTTLLVRIEAVFSSRPPLPNVIRPWVSKRFYTRSFPTRDPPTFYPRTKLRKSSLINKWQNVSTRSPQTLQMERSRIKYKKKRYCRHQRSLLPLNEWRLGRFVHRHLSADQNVSVVDIRTQSGIVTRNITTLSRYLTRLCQLILASVKITCFHPPH